MMLHVPGVLTRDDALECRKLLDAAPWVDGNITSGEQAAKAKRNRQLPIDAPITRELGNRVLSALARSPLFISAAIPKRIVPPLFNRYEGGEHFEFHVDNAIRAIPGTADCLRTDVSCTLFFSDPDEYDGGELIVKDTYGTHGAKLPAGDMILYPATSLHRVTPVTRGARVASFFWVQSMISSDWQRTMLFDLDQTIQKLRAQLGDMEHTIALTSHYHNLLRQWSEL
ncbi:MAG: Fe2+-dependent dioxygenase [Steroidobacteraceae bacterium]